MGNPITDFIFGPAVDLIKEVVDRQVVDKAGAAKINDEIQKALAVAAIEQQKSQISVNTEEAKSTNWFVAGGRPAFMWVGCAILLNSYLVAPYMNEFFHHSVTTLDDHMWELIFGILGMGGIRQYGKMKGIEK